MREIDRAALENRFVVARNHDESVFDACSMPCMTETDIRELESAADHAYAHYRGLVANLTIKYGQAHVDQTITAIERLHA